MQNILAYRHETGRKLYRRVKHSLQLGSTYYDDIDMIGFLFRVDSVHVEYTDIRVMCVSLIGDADEDDIEYGLFADPRGQKDGWQSTQIAEGPVADAIQRAFQAATYLKEKDH